MEGGLDGQDRDDSLSDTSDMVCTGGVLLPKTLSALLCPICLPECADIWLLQLEVEKGELDDELPGGEGCGSVLVIKYVGRPPIIAKKKILLPLEQGTTPLKTVPKKGSKGTANNVSFQY